MRRCPPWCGGSNLKGRLPSSRSPEIGAGQRSHTQRSVMAALAATPPGVTFGGGPSKRTRGRPRAAFPVTPRPVGFNVIAIAVSCQCFSMLSISRSLVAGLLLALWALAAAAQQQPKNIIVLFADGVAATQWEFGRYSSRALRNAGFAVTDVVFQSG